MHAAKVQAAWQKLVRSRGLRLYAGRPAPLPPQCFQLEGHLGLQGLELLVLGLGLGTLRYAG